MSGTKVLAFTPTYNEAANIKPLIEALLALPLDIEVLVVDDRSPDGTGDIVADMARHDSRVHLVSREPPRGRGYAGREGFAWFQQHPEFAYLVEMDADFSHHPRFLPALIQALSGADVAVGSRFVPGGCETGRDRSRQLLSKLANAYLRVILRTRQRDCTTGYRAYTQAAFRGIDFSRFVSCGPTIVGETILNLLWKGRKIVEVPIVFEDRTLGESKLSANILFKSLWFPIMLRLCRVFGIQWGIG